VPVVVEEVNITGVPRAIMLTLMVGFIPVVYALPKVNSISILNLAPQSWMRKDNAGSKNITQPKHGYITNQYEGEN